MESARFWFLDLPQSDASRFDDDEKEQYDDDSCPCPGECSEA